MLIDPWHGEHDDRPEWDRPSFAVCLGMIALTWTPLVWAAVWGWRHLK